MTGDFYVPYYMIWDDPGEDGRASRYLRHLFEALLPLGVGSYVNEANLEGRPGAIIGCYSAQAWKRLRELRRAWDPGGVFCDFFNGA